MFFPAASGISTLKFCIPTEDEEGRERVEGGEKRSIGGVRVWGEEGWSGRGLRYVCGRKREVEWARERGEEEGRRGSFRVKQEREKERREKRER